MPKNLKRFYERRHLHFITFSCYRRLPFLGSPRRRDALLRLIERVRKEHRCPVLGYVIMPEHLHILIAPPEKGDPSTFMKAIKQRSSRQFRTRGRKASGELFAERKAAHFWQRRFHDFNVFTDHKRVQKLRYMHRNPVKRGLVESPELWRWSSYRFYMLDEPGVITITKFEDLPDIIPTVRKAENP
jgi:putative transposase